MRQAMVAVRVGSQALDAKGGALLVTVLQYANHSHSFDESSSRKKKKGELLLSVA